MSNVKEICKKYRTDPQECLNQLRSLKPNKCTVGQWAFYAASIGYYEVFRACVNQVDEAIRVKHSPIYTTQSLLMNACVGGNPKIVDAVARQHNSNSYSVSEVLKHCAKAGKKDLLDVLLNVGTELNVSGWSMNNVIEKCLKFHQNTIAAEYLKSVKENHTQYVLKNSFANNCCIMGNTDGLIMLNNFCKEHGVELKYTWKWALEESCKHLRVQTMDFLLSDKGVEMFGQTKGSDDYCSGVATAAFWARGFIASDLKKSEQMFDAIFGNVPFEVWKHKVDKFSFEKMENRYALYLNTKIHANINTSVDTPNSRRKI